MELVKVNGNQSLVAQQLEDAIEIMDERIQKNKFGEGVKKLAEAFEGGMLTTGEFITQIATLKAIHKKDMEDLLNDESVLLALRNTQYMLSK